LWGDPPYLTNTRPMGWDDPAPRRARFIVFIIISIISFRAVG
jgi:hypothetical protein